MWLGKSKKALVFLVALGTTSVAWAGPSMAATNKTAGALGVNQHIVNKRADISFDTLNGFVHQKIASYYEVSEYNRALGIQILIQNPAGAVSIAPVLRWARLPLQVLLVLWLLWCSRPRPVLR